MILRNARIVLCDEVVHGCLAVRDGRIADISSGNSAAPDSIDFDGDLLLPGLVELHTDNLERNLMPRPKVRWPTLPAVFAHDAQVAAAGITTVLDALSVGDIDHESVRAEGLEETVRHIGQAADRGLLRADHLLHMRCEIAVPNVLDLLRPFLAEPRLRLVSLMDHTPGQRQWTDFAHYRTYVTGKKGWSDEKRERMITELLAAQERYADTHRQAITAMCRERGLAMATHDDTTEDHVHQAASEGIAISEFPTTLAAARAANAHHMGVIMGAPNVVRGGSHSGNAAAIDLARHGLLDALSSDYVPASLLHAAFLLGHQAGFSLPEAVATVTANPAAMAGLADRGRLAAGNRADLLRVKLLEDGDAPHPVVSAVWREGRQVL
jgi:alpha-D-ribose 1-methylphosphonate 5-triphosphate diphosphatase